MTRWYRAYEGTVSDPKLAEVALIAGCSRAVVIAAWHSFLENAAGLQDGGRIDITARRLAALLCEPLATMEAVVAGMEEVGLLSDGFLPAWKGRQYESDTSTERSRKHREAKRNADATLQQRDATPPETETDTEVTSSDFEVKSSEVLSVCEPTQAKQVSKRNSYPQEFERFWSGYPTDPNMSKKEAFTVWKRLSADAQQAAIAALPAFNEYCRKNPDYRPIHACRFLSKDRASGFINQKPEAVPQAKPAAPPGAPSHEELLARYSKPKAQIDVRPDHETDVFPARGALREVDGDKLRDQAGESRMGSVGSVLRSPFEVVPGGVEDGSQQSDQFDHSPGPMAAVVR